MVEVNRMAAILKERYSQKAIDTAAYIGKPPWEREPLIYCFKTDHGHKKMVERRLCKHIDCIVAEIMES